MDKCLESKFVLKGGRSPYSPVMVTASTHAGPDGDSRETIRTESRLSQLLKPSTIRSETPSGFDSDSTYSSAEKPRDSPPEVHVRNNNHDFDRPVSPEDNAVVAYFIRPGGTIVPVDILAEDRPPRSWTGSISEVEQPDPRFARLGNEAQAPSAELLLDRAWASAQLQSDAAEHEALFSDLAPEWMYDNRRPMSR